MRFAQEISIFNPYAIADALVGVDTKITQTANEIRLEAAATYATQTGLQTLSSRVSQTATAISFSLSKNGDRTAVLSMTYTKEDGSTINLAAQSIEFTGLVRFNDLSTSGSTSINGANIQTGTITANKISTAGLDASVIKTGTMSGDRISAGTITGTTISGGTLIATGTSTNDVTIGGGKIKVPWIEFYTQSGNFAASWTVDNSASNGNNGYHRLWCGYGIRLSGNASTWNWIENPSVIDANTYFKAGVFDQYNNLQFTSDRRKKQNITYLDIDEAAKRVMALRAARFVFKSAPEVIHHGFIAQDVQEVVNDGWGVVESYVDPDEQVERLSLKYTELIADLVATVQAQDKRIKALEGENG